MYAEVLRKIIHILLALSLAYLAPRVSMQSMMLLGILLTGIFLGARILHHFERLRSVQRTTYGEFFFVAGVMVTSWLFLPLQPIAFQVGMLVLAIADPAAALIGKRFGIHRYVLRGDSLSYEGSGIFFISTTVIFFCAGLTFANAMLGAVLLTGIEAIAPVGSDNFFLPLVAGILLASVLVV